MYISAKSQKSRLPVSNFPWKTGSLSDTQDTAGLAVAEGVEDDGAAHPPSLEGEDVAVQVGDLERLAGVLPGELPDVSVDLGGLDFLERAVAAEHHRPTRGRVRVHGREAVVVVRQERLAAGGLDDLREDVATERVDEVDRHPAVLERALDRVGVGEVLVGLVGGSRSGCGQQDKGCADWQRHSRAHRGSSRSTWFVGHLVAWPGLLQSRHLHHRPRRGRRICLPEDFPHCSGALTRSTDFMCTSIHPRSRCEDDESC